jgi:hypothetical protein
LKLSREDGRGCQEIRVKSRYVKSGYVIGRVCKVKGGWKYGYVGPTGAKAIYGPVKTKSMAIRKAVKGYTTFVGKGLK